MPKTEGPSVHTQRHLRSTKIRLLRSPSRSRGRQEVETSRVVFLSHCEYLCASAFPSLAQYELVTIRGAAPRERGADYSQRNVSASRAETAKGQAVPVSGIPQIASRYLLISVSALSAVMKIGTFSIPVAM
jgi:hypothetical protein